MEDKKLQLSKEEGSYLEDVKFAYYAWVNDRTVSLNPIPQEVLLEKYPWADKPEENAFERLFLEFFSDPMGVERLIDVCQIASLILTQLKSKLQQDKTFEPKSEDVLGSFQRLINAYRCTMLQYEAECTAHTEKMDLQLAQLSEGKKQDEKEKGV